MFLKAMHSRIWLSVCFPKKSLRFSSSFLAFGQRNIGPKQDLRLAKWAVVSCMRHSTQPPINMDLAENIVTLEQIQETYSFLQASPVIVRTPTVSHVQHVFSQSGVSDCQPFRTGIIENGHGNNASPETMTSNICGIDLHLKMENMQSAGSFKMRGVLNQIRKVREQHGNDCKLVTMSAGNYGKAFAHCVGNSDFKSVCLMPDTAPQNRVKLIETLGVTVKQVAPSELQNNVDRMVEEEGYVFCHPFDDVALIAGYASSALELLEEVPEPDVVLVCCGGGGLVAGVAAAISRMGHKDCRVYAVEPDGAPTMYESFKARRPVTLPDVRTVAVGLAPPYAGALCYKHCRWFVEDILLVSDKEILDTMRLLFHRGIKAEPSGCAALAALLSGKVPDVKGKTVVVYITGGNVSFPELAGLMTEDT